MPRLHPRWGAFLPFCAVLTLADCASDKASGPTPVAAGDTVPPVLVWFIGPRDAVSPGDTILFRFRARDSVGVTHAVLRLSGSVVGEIPLDLPDAPKDTEGWFEVWLPNGLEHGTVATATLVVSDAAGRKSAGTYAIRIGDSRPPTVTMEMVGLPEGEGATIRTGATLHLLVKGHDNGRMSYIGFSGGGLRDSVRAAWTDDSRTFLVTIPESWRQERPVLTAWARDEAGNMSAVAQNNTREVPVFDWVDHPIQTTPLANDGAPVGVTWDARRNVAYVLYGNSDGTGSNSRIEVISANGGARGTPIPLPVYPQAFAFSASGDSLVVTLPDARALGVIDLRQATRSTVVVPLQIATDTSELLGPFTRTPRSVQVSGSHVFVSLVHGLFPARLLDVNLATGTQGIRSDLGGSPDVSQNPAFFRLGDGRLLLGPESLGSAPHDHFLYQPGSNSFTRTPNLRPAGPSQFSASPSGHIMLSSTVFNAALDSVTTVSTRDWKENYQLVAALSADGTAVYTSTFYGYQKVRLSDGFVLEQVRLGTTPLLLAPLPDGSRLIAVGGLPGSNKGDWAVMLIDLR